jgi:RNA polymerase primary sigma factor
VAQRERKVIRIERELAAKLGRDPTTEEVAAEAELEPAQVDEIRDLTRVVTSLDRPLGTEEGTAFGEMVAEERPGPEEEVQVSLRDRTLRAAVAELPEPERRVIELRYGIDGENPTPIREASRRLEMKQAEVRELESKALERLARVREVESLSDAA